MFSFLHLGDLHLDSPFAAFSMAQAATRRARQYEALEELLRAGVARGAQMVLIAGDCFDNPAPRTEAVARFFGILEGLSVPVVIAPGNHDPHGEGSFYRCEELPEQVYVFDSYNLQCFTFEHLKTKVFGYAFTSAALSRSPLSGETPVGEDGYLHLLCAHADLASPVSRYAPVTVGDIVSFGIDYAALGHIHQSPEPQRIGSTEIRYCGFAEGRSFDELGEGGVWIVSLDVGEKPAIERRIISVQRYEEAQMSVDGCESQSELTGRTVSLLNTFSAQQRTHLRLTLTGAADPEWISRLISDVQTYRHGLASLTLCNETVPVIDGAALQKDVTLRGALYRTLYMSLIDDDPETRQTAARALQIGLAAIEGRSIPTEETGV